MGESQLHFPKYYTLGKSILYVMGRTYIKSYHIYSVHCFNDLYNTMKRRQFKTDFSIRLCCIVNWAVRSSVCFAKVSGHSDLLVPLCILMCILMKHSDNRYFPMMFTLKKKMCSLTLNIAFTPICCEVKVKQILLCSNIYGWYFVRMGWN